MSRPVGQRRALHAAARPCSGHWHPREVALSPADQKAGSAGPDNAVGRHTGSEPGLHWQRPCSVWLGSPGTRGLAHTPEVPTWASGCWSTSQVRCEDPVRSAGHSAPGQGHRDPPQSPLLRLSRTQDVGSLQMGLPPRSLCSRVKLEAASTA